MARDPSYVRVMPPAALMTADELLRTHLPDKHVELVRGVLVVREPAGYRHGDITARVTKLLMDVVGPGGLGRVLAAETCATPRSRQLGYPALAPDLVVEVLSPGDRPGETLAKVGDWCRSNYLRRGR